MLIELLSPGFKPVQLTSDLRSFWSGTYFEVRKELRRRYHRYPALQPSMPFITTEQPRQVKSLRAQWLKDGYYLTWRAPKYKDWRTQPMRYVVYRFRKGELVNIEDATKIVAITLQPSLKLPYADGKEQWTYAVTALNPVQNESKIKKKNVKL